METTDSIALKTLKTAQTQVEELLIKAEQTLEMLQQNRQQVMSQKIGLSHQKMMLNELISKIQDLTNKELIKNTP